MTNIRDHRLYRKRNIRYEEDSQADSQKGYRYTIYIEQTNRKKEKRRKKRLPDRQTDKLKNNQTHRLTPTQTASQPYTQLTELVNGISRSTVHPTPVKLI